MSLQSGETAPVGAGRALFKTIPGRSTFIWVALFSLFVNILLLVLPFFSIQVFDRVITSGSIETLYGLTALAVVAFCFSAAFDMLRAVLLNRFAVGFESHIAPLVLEASVSDPAKRAEGGTHDFVKLRELRQLVSGGTITTLIDAPFLPAFIIVLYLIHPFYGQIAFIGGVVLAILGIIGGRIASSERVQSNVAQSQAQAVLDGVIRNANLVRAMGWTPGAIRQFMHLSDQAMAPVTRASERVSAIASIAHAVRMVLQVACIAVGCYLVLNNEVLPGSMMASAILIGRTLAPMEGLLRAWRALLSGWDAWKRVAAATASVLNVQRKTLLPEPTGELELKGVNYFLRGTKRRIISDISFRCVPATVVVIIGPTGAGKSTLLRMIAGLDRPSTGSIRFDGAEIENWDPDQLGQYIGYLPQEVTLLGGTISEAISGFDEEANDDDVVAAAIHANAHDMILSLPKGYETDIGRDGSKLSGGQRQRIGLARAMFGKRKLILLDEPNSNLDPAGEEALCEAIRKAKANGATVIVVTHRPRILTVADSVLVMRDGVRVAFGSPAEVMPQATAGATPMRSPVVAAKRPQAAPNRTLREASS